RRGCRLRVPGWVASGAPGPDLGDTAAGPAGLSRRPALAGRGTRPYLRRDGPAADRTTRQAHHPRERPQGAPASPREVRRIAPRSGGALAGGPDARRPGGGTPNPRPVEVLPLGPRSKAEEGVTLQGRPAV